MNSYNPYIKQYKQNSVLTASPETVLIMLYDGAINFLNRAKVSMDNREIEETHNNIVKAQRIITEFMNTLDMKNGGEVAENLFRLYDYLSHRLIQANVKKDSSMLDEVIAHLRELKQTWEQAIKIAAGEEKESLIDKDLINRSA
ncbi:MAG: flagellar export chaperone FliS [Candidatus Gastranaerophilales bacterium]|nr:flagellar export chaperone FliS [Candidatus Gastranaerophilales bacterium]